MRIVKPRGLCQADAIYWTLRSITMGDGNCQIWGTVSSWRHLLDIRVDALSFVSAIQTALNHIINYLSVLVLLICALFFILASVGKTDWEITGSSKGPHGWTQDACSTSWANQHWRAQWLSGDIRVNHISPAHRFSEQSQEVRAKRGGLSAFPARSYCFSLQFFLDPYICCWCTGILFGTALLGGRKHGE